MPKIKSNRGAKKRIRKTATGYKHRGSNRAHLLTHKASKRKRQLRGARRVCASDQNHVEHMLCE